MVSRLETWVRRLVSSRTAPSASASASASATASGTAADPGATRLIGPAAGVTRLLVVRPDTVAVVTAAGAAPQLKLPGELLVPPLLSPGAPAVTARAVSTDAVDLDVTVSELITFDGHPVDRAVLRVSVRLDDREQHRALLELAAGHPDDLEEVVLAAVHRELTAAVRGAVRMNRLTDLRRLTLAAVLEDRWLPARLGAGTLRLLRLRVQRVRWPGEDEPTVPVPRPPVPAPPGSGPPGPAEPAPAPAPTPAREAPTTSASARPSAASSAARR